MPPLPEVGRLSTSDADPRAPGDDLWLLPDDGNLVHCTLLMRRGALDESIERAGSWPLLVDLLDEGSRRSPGELLTRRIEALGGELSTGSGWQSSWLQVSGLAAHGRELLELLRETVLEPEFSASAALRERSGRLAALARMAKAPASLADLAVRRVLHPGERLGLPLTGTLSGLELPNGQANGGGSSESELDAELHEGWSAALSTRDLGLVALGGLPEQSWLAEWLGSLRPEVERSGDPESSDQSQRLSEWSPRIQQPVEGRAATASSPSGERSILLVERVGAEQTELRVGHRSPPRGAPGWAARRVLNSVLGGKFTSRLNLRLRERDGSTYGASSSLMEQIDGGLFVARCSADNRLVDRAVIGVLEEMQLLLEEPITEAELSDAKTYLLGVLPFRLQTLEGRSAQLQTQWLHQIAPEAARREIEAIAEVDSRAVLEAARQCLRPSDAVVVLVGCSKILAPPLRELAANGFTCKRLTDSQQLLEPAPPETRGLAVQ